LDERLKGNGTPWLFGLKTRQGALGSFGSLAEMIRFLKSGESSAQGGGAIYRIIDPNDFDATGFSLAKEYVDAVHLFTPLMRTLVPTSSEQTRLESQKVIDLAAETLPEFDPSSVEDGRKKVFQAVAVRQGQSKFREKLLSAYGSRCAVTGTAVVATLQAAHVFPYKGPETNKVQNGILLRADIHNLFDLGLVGIDPDTYRIVIADELRCSSFAKLEGRLLRLPMKTADRPSKLALQERKNYFAGKS
jgi:predicted restriction endonuclease